MSLIKWLVVIVIAVGAYLVYGYLRPQIYQDLSLKRPDAEFPAAGVCDLQSGDIAAVEIWQDIPQPRCVRVLADQRLKVVNKTDQEISIGFDNLPIQAVGLRLVKVPTDGEYQAVIKFGQYLAPGVHRLLAQPFAGPEIWLVTEDTPL